MDRIIKKALAAACSFTLALTLLQASSYEDQKKREMIKDLEVMKHHLEAGYAPMEWKKESIGFDLNEAFKNAKNKIIDKTPITTKDFQQIARSFVNSLKDYHVGITFYSTESASLPFSVRAVDERYFIDWTDPIRLPSSYYGLSLGDELLEFDQQPIATVIAELQSRCSKSSNALTDIALAAMNLTQRTGATGDLVPQGTVLVTTRSKETGRVATRQLRWSYSPERIKNPFDFLLGFDMINPFLINKKSEKRVADGLKKNELFKFSMMNPVHEIYARKSLDRNGGFGSRKSFLPTLGAVVWPDDKKEGEQGDKVNPSFWHAYVYLSPTGRQIGYIRIPHYVLGDSDIQEFGKILAEMEKNTDALVIDQLHNFGGFVHVQYALASILTNKPLETPYHRIKLSQKEVMKAIQLIELIDYIEKNLDILKTCDHHNNDNHEGDNQEKEDEEANPYQELLFLKVFCEQILEDWDAGRVLTRATPIAGVDHINPHAKYHYSKPILMLIDELDFSGGDFVPAILQDNKRAVLFGSKTAGAGGYIAAFEFPNLHGIDLCTYTASIAERKNLQKIENVGVIPDIEYQLTAADLQNGYLGYIEALHRAVALFFDDAAPILDASDTPIPQSESVEEPVFTSSAS